MSAEELLADPSWKRNRRLLTRWMFTHLATWLGGIAIMIAGHSNDTALSIGLGVFFLSVAPYIVALVFAYRVQRALNIAGLYKSGAWQVVVGGLLLNPLVIGWVIPLSVVNSARKVERRFPLAPVAA
jgi:hypothetical protein